MTQVNPFSLAGRTALIAGASRGIGQAIAESVARAGARTILAARSTAALDKIAATLNAEGLEATTLELDIANRASRQRAVEAAGEVDILINVAGTNLRRRFVDYTPDQYERLVSTNLTGLFELTQGIGRGMIERGRGGKVVFISSLSTFLGLPYVSVYTVTKAALNGLTRQLAAEWGRHNIQVNAIAPGFILTDLNRDMWAPPHMKEWLATVQPNPRLGTPEDMAPLAVFLAGPGADYITGQVIVADGGLSTSCLWPFEPAS